MERKVGKRPSPFAFGMSSGFETARRNICAIVLMILPSSISNRGMTKWQTIHSHHGLDRMKQKSKIKFRKNSRALSTLQKLLNPIGRHRIAAFCCFFLFLILSFIKRSWIDCHVFTHRPTCSDNQAERRTEFHAQQYNGRLQNGIEVVKLRKRTT